MQWRQRRRGRGGGQCLGIAGCPSLAGTMTSWGGVDDGASASLAVPLLACARWRWGADKGALAALAVPHWLARRQAGGGTDNSALAFWAVPSLAHATGAVVGEVCLGILGYPLLAGKTMSWRGSVPWHCWPSLARRRNGKLAVGQMAVPWHPWTLLVHVLVATAGWTESLAIPYLLA